MRIECRRVAGVDAGKMGSGVRVGYECRGQCVCFHWLKFLMKTIFQRAKKQKIEAHAVKPPSL